jgi:hypothetical protein
MDPSDNGPGDAARLLGRRLDRFLGLVGRIPNWAWTLIALITLASTYPRRGQSRVIVGIVLSGRLTVWFSNLVVIGLLVVVASLSVFAIRSLLHYMEQGRWPKRAAGIEMDALTLAEAQLHSDADEFSKSAEESRILARTLAEARDTIVFLTAELARARGEAEDPPGEQGRLADGQ